MAKARFNFFPASQAVLAVYLRFADNWYRDVTRQMDVKGLFVQIFMVALLIGYPSVSAAQAHDGDRYTDGQCADCHEEMADDHALSVHGGLECLKCHTQAVEQDHEKVAPVDCRQCHAPHDELVIHDAHARVTCRACHMKRGIPAIGSESGRIIWSGVFRPGTAFLPHQAVRSEADATCGNCHFQGNVIGASSMILPAKSILCMPCHVATFSVGDGTTLVSLSIFLAGMVGLGAVWFSGSMPKRAHRYGEKKCGAKARSACDGLFLDEPMRMLNTLIADVIFLQKLFRLSPTRWVIHALIFFPFLFRFTFGLTALVFSILVPNWTVTTAMLDKNLALRAFLFDLTGLMILAGASAAFFRSRNEQTAHIAWLPEPSRGMSALLGMIVLAGFILEGLRIAMTGWPDGAGWAFFGFGVSLLIKGMNGLTDTYGYGWHAHAVLAGAFMALIPFTRMSHILTAPIALVINARPENGKCS